MLDKELDEWKNNFPQLIIREFNRSKSSWRSNEYRAFPSARSPTEPGSSPAWRCRTGCSCCATSRCSPYSHTRSFFILFLSYLYFCFNFLIKITFAMLLQITIAKSLLLQWMTDWYKPAFPNWFPSCSSRSSSL